MEDAGSRDKAFSKYPAPCIHYPASYKFSVPSVSLWLNPHQTNNAC